MIREAVLAEIGRIGMSVSRLAADAGVDRATLCMWLGGSRGIGLESAEAVMRALGLSIAAPTAPPRDETARTSSPAPCPASRRRPGNGPRRG